MTEAQTGDAAYQPMRNDRAEFDPNCGSGTTIEAAGRLGFRLDRDRPIRRDLTAARLRARGAVFEVRG